MGLVYRMGWQFFRCVFTTYFRWHYYNPERVPLSGSVILASNHSSFIDPPLVGAALHRAIGYLARDTLFGPPLGWLLRRWNAVPVDREGGGASGVRRILEVLHSDKGVIIFPEGTRTRDGHLQRPRSGVGLIVLRSDAPVVPVRVFGTFEAYGRHLRFPRPKSVAVKYGKPLLFAAQRAEARNADKTRLRELYQQVTDDIMSAIAQLQPFADKENFP
jgi:1-acyl-sn-glycerol-3-phosphate acyltransferase